MAHLGHAVFLYICNKLSTPIHYWLMKKIYTLFISLLFVGYVSSQDPITYCVENDITHGFLNDFSYEGMALDSSFVMRYFKKPHDYRLDAPVPVKLSWTHQDGADAQRVEVSESSSYSNPIVFKVNKDAAEYDLYNMIPGKKYYYRIVSVKGGNNSIVGRGQIEPTGMLRWIYAEGTWNVRDMGGWTGLKGYPIRYGKIFRGGQLTNPKDPYNVLLTDAGIEAMRNVGIRAELDLRSSSQAHYSKPSFADESYAADFTNIATTSARMWKYDNDDSNIRAFQWIINELKAGKPVFYHCQNGADRTGTMGFLIGALLGMNESDLAKDYELTTFCEKAAAEFDPDEKGFARLRNYEGKKGSTDSSSDPKDYMFAPLIDKLNGIAGASIQEKIYNFFKNGVSGTKISVADLDWFINYMMNPVTLNVGEKIELNRGESLQIVAQITAKSSANPNPVVTFTSSDDAVATVTGEGLIKAVGYGKATIKASLDGFTNSIAVTVPVAESVLPDTVFSGDYYYSVKSNMIKNGSFEYVNAYENWTGGDGKELSAEAFDLKKYDANSYNVYLESKGDGDASSIYSICKMWTLVKNKSYVFGYKIKNSTDKTTENNANLVVRMVTMNSDKTAVEKSQVLEGNPTYSGEWTDVQYVFTNPKGNDGFSSLQIVFTHLSEGGNNTCFDNFYLCALSEPTWVAPIQATTPMRMINDDKIYNLAGMEVTNPGKGIYIRNGKKYIVK